MHAKSTTLQNRIRQEQTRILYSNRHTIFAATIIVLLITTFALWPVANKPLIVVWSATSILLVLARLVVSQGYVNLPKEAQNRDHKKWSSYFVYGSLTNGLVWGLLPALFDIQMTIYFSLVICIHAGYISAASNVTSIYLPTCLAFILPSTTMFAITTLICGGWSYWAYACLMLLFGVVTALSASRNSKFVAQQITLRYQNTELMNDLTVQRDNAEQAMLAKNRFLAAASHDLRQPVHALGLFVDSLTPHLQTPQAFKILDKIRQSSAALGSLFHGLLDISKLDADVIENNPTHFRLDDLAERMHADCAGAAAERNLTFNMPNECDYVAFADRALLERIMRNITSNAIKYTDTGSVSYSCGLTDDNKIRIDITDTGKGIPEAELENIFSEYHQLENSERDREKGLGLGLAIVRRLGLLTDIGIEVKSEVNVGSVFSVILPMGDESQIAAPKPITTISKVEDLKIVVIDDELDIIEGMRNVLTVWGCTTYTGTSTAEAMTALQGQDMPDLIIADFRLKEHESGLDAIQTIRDEYNHDIPAALITGDTSPERLRQAASASAILMHKPVEPENLRALLADISTH